MFCGHLNEEQAAGRKQETALGNKEGSVEVSKAKETDRTGQEENQGGRLCIHLFLQLSLHPQLAGGDE